MFLFHRCFLLSWSIQNNFCPCLTSGWDAIGHPPRLTRLPDSWAAFWRTHSPLPSERANYTGFHTAYSNVQRESSALQRWGFYSRHTNNSCSGIISHKSKHLTWTESTLILSQSLLQMRSDLGQVILYCWGPAVKWKEWYFLETFWTKQSLSKIRKMQHKKAAIWTKAVWSNCNINKKCTYSVDFRYPTFHTVHRFHRELFTITNRSIFINHLPTTAEQIICNNWFPWWILPLFQFTNYTWTQWDFPHWWVFSPSFFPFYENSFNL